MHDLTAELADGVEIVCVELALGAVPLPLHPPRKKQSMCLAQKMVLFHKMWWIKPITLSMFQQPAVWILRQRLTLFSMTA